MIIEFLNLPVPSGANLREHWSIAHRRHKNQKGRVLMALIADRVSKELPVKITFTRLSPRKLDSDNLQFAFKYIRDAVADYFIPGLLPGRADDDSRITWHYTQEKSTHKGFILSVESATYPAQ